jgi:APA family basic amino acid/polyamine antiporter
LSIPNNPRGALLRILGVVFGVAVTIGGSLGVGILRKPGTVAAALGSPALILAFWLLGGIYALLSAVTVAELGTMFPQAGGFYIYARNAFGDAAGFTIGCCDWLGNAAGIAFGSITLGELASDLAPALAGHAVFIAIGTIVFFATLHWLGLRTTSRVQQLTSLLISTAFLALIAACFWRGGPTTAAPTDHHIAGNGSAAAMMGAVIVAFRVIFVAYDGWYEPIYFVEENRNPARDLPRSLIRGELAVIAIYLLINAAFLYVLTVPELSASALPAATVARRVFGGYAGVIITAISLLTMPPLLNVSLLGGTRILFAMSRDRLVPYRAATVNQRGTPMAAMLLTAGAGMLLVVTGTFDKILAVAGFWYVLEYCSAYAALLVLRKRQPSAPRPFRVWAYPWATLFVLAMGLMFLAGSTVSDPRNSLASIGALLISYPLFRLMRRKRDAAR